jgi:hypothetical protein
MARKPLGLLAALPAVLLLVACTTLAEPAAPASAPSSAPASAPGASSTAAPMPSSASTAAPTSATPTSEPEPVATATPSLPYCGDEFVRAQWATSGWSWGGTAEEELAQAAPSASFDPSGLIAGHEVVCAATYRHPTDGERGYADTSVAVLRGGEATGAAIEAWARANGWDAGAQYGIRGAEGSMDAKLFWHVIPLDEVPIGSDEAAVALAGAESGDVIVSVFDWR